MNLVVSRKRLAQSDRQASSLELKLLPGVPMHFSQQVLDNSEMVRCSWALACSCCKNRCSSGETPPFWAIIYLRLAAVTTSNRCQSRSSMLCGIVRETVRVYSS